MPNCLAKCTAGVVSTSAIWVDGVTGCPVLIDKTVSVDALCNESVAYTQGGAPWAGSTIPVKAPEIVTVCGPVTTTPLSPEFDAVQVAGCGDSVPLVRTAFYDEITKAFSTVEWRDAATNAIVAAPTVFIPGPCATDAATADRRICANMVNAEIWDLTERTTVVGGVSTLTYLDPDASPMVDVTAEYASIRHSGECDCLRDNPVSFVVDLAVNAVDGVDTPNEFGETFSATFIFENAGPATATAPTIRATVTAYQFTPINPILLSYAGGATGPATATFAEMNVGVALASMPPGSSVMAVLNTQNGNPSHVSTRFDAYIVAAAPDVDSNPSNNSVHISL